MIAFGDLKKNQLLIAIMSALASAPAFSVKVISFGGIPSKDGGKTFYIAQRADGIFQNQGVSFPTVTGYRFDVVVQTEAGEKPLEFNEIGIKAATGLTPKEDMSGYPLAANGYPLGITPNTQATRTTLDTWVVSKDFADYPNPTAYEIEDDNPEGTFLFEPTRNWYLDPVGFSSIKLVVGPARVYKAYRKICLGAQQTRSMNLGAVPAGAKDDVSGAAIPNDVLAQALHGASYVYRYPLDSSLKNYATGNLIGLDGYNVPMPPFSFGGQDPYRLSIVFNQKKWCGTSTTVDVVSNNTTYKLRVPTGYFTYSDSGVASLRQKLPSVFTDRQFTVKKFVPPSVSNELNLLGTLNLKLAPANEDVGLAGQVYVLIGVADNANSPVTYYFSDGAGKVVPFNAAKPLTPVFKGVLTEQMSLKIVTGLSADVLKALSGFQVTLYAGYGVGSGKVADNDMMTVDPRFAFLGLSEFLGGYRFLQLTMPTNRKPVFPLSRTVQQ